MGRPYLTAICVIRITAIAFSAIFQITRNQLQPKATQGVFDWVAGFAIVLRTPLLRAYSMAGDGL
jgi:hypothetical protein